MSESVLSGRETAASAVPTAQDAFLNQSRRARTLLGIRLLDGHELRGRLKSFDRFALVMDVDGVEYLVFKHAVATIADADTPARG